LEAEVAKQKITVSYSWQSDLPNRTNRGFIERALQKAIDSLRSEAKAVLDPCMDRDTLDVPGTPDIPSTIFDKIDQCHIFVGDVSIINPKAAADDRKTPNPNVLLELGYAAKTLTWDNVICVYNKNYGEVKDLPFDLQRRRMCIYAVAEGQEEKAQERDRLASVLREAIDSILRRLEKQTEEEASAKQLTPEGAAAKVHDWLADDSKRIQLHQLVSGEKNKLVQWIVGPELPVQIAGRLSPEDFRHRLIRYEEMSQILVSIMAAGCYYDTQAHEKLWIDALQGVANYSSDFASFAGEQRFIHLRRYPALLLLYSGGIAAVAGGNYGTLLSLLTKPKIYDPNGSWTVTDALHPEQILDTETFSWMLGGQRRYFTPMSDHLFEVLRLPLKAYLHNDQQYHLGFDRFEYMRALLEFDRQEHNPAIGRFSWQRRPMGPDIRQEIDAEVKNEGPNWAPFRAGWFGGQIDRFEAARASVNKKAAGIHW